MYNMEKSHLKCEQYMTFIDTVFHQYERYFTNFVDVDHSFDLEKLAKKFIDFGCNIKYHQVIYEYLKHVKYFKMILCYNIEMIKLLHYTITEMTVYLKMI